MNTEKCNIESTNSLTQIESQCTVGAVIRFIDIEKGLKQQINNDVKQLRSNYVEQNRLRKHVLRYRDLERDAKAREERIRRATALVGVDDFEDVGKQLKAGEDVSTAIGLPLNSDLPLWTLMQSILEQTSEIQVVELQHALAHFGRNTSRQAIESALAAHKETFETKPRGREKFVSLKR